MKLRYRPELILAVLLIEMLLSPIFDFHPHLGGLAALVMVAVISTTANHTAARQFRNWVLTPLVNLWVCARTAVAYKLWPGGTAQISSITGLAISLIILGLMVQHFNNASVSDSCLIVEALITYLAIAVCFSQLYEIIDRTVAHAFSQAIPPPRGSVLIYFSLVTLTSLGSGQISPVNPYVRIVTAFESIAGLFYIAIVVARLVSFKTNDPKV